MDKRNEILKKQNELKKEVKFIKKKIPSYIIGFIFFTVVSLYFLEDNFYHFFGNSVNLVIGFVLLLTVVCFFFLFKNFLKIKKNESESKALGSELYRLMKLDKSNRNE